ncbi:MAG: hypothetical protein J07HB67_01502 [halophilic archaeon J07HB67]|jgi:hypothetical protein|nr:MAG: hypothetical protein J07HB67_01502 [halophilic archaeon J07HB67]
MSTDEPRQTAADTPADTDDPTYVGVSVGVEHLIVAAPADGRVGTQLVIEGDHLHERHAILVEATNAMQARRFDDPTGEAQLFEAMWHHLRPQVYDAATRAVRHAQRFETPRLVVDERHTREATLWERRTESGLRAWLPAALQRAVVEKAREAEVPVVCRAVADARGVCHECGTRGRVDDRELVCSREDCPVRRVAHGLSDAVRLARRGRR